MLFAATLTVDQVKSEVDRIAAVADDDEAAHSAEDDLHVEVLTAIAVGALTGLDAQRTALAALKSQDVSFNRWCA